MALYSTQRFYLISKSYSLLLSSLCRQRLSGRRESNEQEQLILQAGQIMDSAHFSRSQLHGSSMRSFWRVIFCKTLNITFMSSDRDNTMNKHRHISSFKTTAKNIPSSQPACSMMLRTTGERLPSSSKSSAVATAADSCGSWYCHRSRTLE